MKKVIRSIRCGAQVLLQIEGQQDLEGISISDVYDFSKASHQNIVALTKKQFIATRRRVTKKTVQRLLTIQGEQCAYCYSQLSGQLFHVDHIIPIVLGGDSGLNNLVISCPQCNLRKGSKVFGSIAAVRQHLGY